MKGYKLTNDDIVDHYINNLKANVMWGSLKLKPILRKAEIELKENRGPFVMFLVDKYNQGKLSCHYVSEYFKNKNKKDV